jgi:hypothetical protein
MLSEDKDLKIEFSDKTGEVAQERKKKDAEEEKKKRRRKSFFLKEASCGL